MKPGKLVKEIKEILNAQLGNKIHDVIIFGSRINHKARYDSDYDVIIIINEKDTRLLRRAISDICYDLELKYNIFIDNQIITLEEINNGIRGKHPVFVNAMKEGVHA